MISKCAFAVAVVSVVSAVVNAQVDPPSCPVASWTLTDLPSAGVTEIEKVTAANLPACLKECQDRAPCLGFVFKGAGNQECGLYSAATVPDTIADNGQFVFYVKDCCSGMGHLDAANKEEFTASDMHQCRSAAVGFNDALSATLSPSGVCTVYRGPQVTGLTKVEDGSYAYVRQAGVAGFCPSVDLTPLTTYTDRFEVTVFASLYEGGEISKAEYQLDDAYNCMESCRVNKACLAVTFFTDEGKHYCKALSSVESVKPYVMGDGLSMTAIPANCIYDKEFSSGRALPAVTAASAEHCAQRTYTSMSVTGAMFFSFNTKADKDNCHQYVSIGALKASDGMVSGTVAGCRSVADYGSGHSNASASGRFGSIASSFLALAAALAGFAVYVL